MERDPAVLERIDAAFAEWRAARVDFEPPSDPPAPDRASRLVREGFGPTVSLFVEVRTGGRSVYLPPDAYDRLERTMNGWLELYAACYGVDCEGDFDLRTAAQLLVDTHDARHAARTLTGVPARSADT